MRRTAAARSLRSYVPERLLFGLGSLIFVFGGVGPNSAWAFGAAVVFVLGTRWLWRPGEPPILLYVFFFQWMQVSLPIFHANWMGLSLNEYGEVRGNAEFAAWLSLAAMALLAAGMRLGARGPSRQAVEAARQQARSLRAGTVFRVYFVAFAAAGVAQSVAGYGGGLTQPLLAVAGIRWTLFFVLAYVCFLQGAAASRYWIMAFALELGLSLGGFFSGFRTVFMFTLFAMFAAGVRIRPRQALGLGAFGVLLLGMGVVWTAVKMDYRDYLSGGTGQQVITVPYGERLAKLGELVAALDGPALVDGFQTMLFRIGYIGYFAKVLDRVPAQFPHTEGAIWGDAILRPLMPRLLFPDKPVVDDSERTAYYTGDRINPGTSVSIGWLAEAYIDFGVFGTLAVSLGYGYMLGRLYRWLLRGRYTKGLLGMGIGSAVLLGASAFESSATKLIAGLAVGLLATWVFARWIVPHSVPWLRPRGSRRAIAGPAPGPVA